MIKTAHSLYHKQSKVVKVVPVDGLVQEKLLKHCCRMQVLEMSDMQVDVWDCKVLRFVAEVQLVINQIGLGRG